MDFIFNKLHLVQSNIQTFNTWNAIINWIRSISMSFFIFSLQEFCRLDVVANFSRKVEVDPTRFLDHEVCPEQQLFVNSYGRQKQTTWWRCGALRRMNTSKLRAQYWTLVCTLTGWFSVDICLQSRWILFLWHHCLEEILWQSQPPLQPSSWFVRKIWGGSFVFLVTQWSGVSKCLQKVANKTQQNSADMTDALDNILS